MKEKFAKAFPTLLSTPPPTVPPDITAILGHLTPQAATLTLASTTTSNEEKKDDDEIVLGMSKLEFESTLSMCGLPPECDQTLFPDWFTKCTKKGMTEHYHMTVIHSHITNN